jgi:hypothetical protein
MSASDSNALRACALQLLDELDLYEQEVDRMLAAWPGKDAYAPVDERIERMRHISNVLFGLSVPWTELLIAHAALMRFLWRLPADQKSHPAIAAFRDELKIAAASLRTRILWRMPVTT